MTCTECKADILVGSRFCPLCGAPAERIGPGSVLGAYKVVDEIASGGMGKVYRAVHQRLNRPVCIKALHPGLALNADMLSRFEREAELMARLRHPNIVSMLDLGQLPGGGLYLVLELVEGVNLRELLQGGPLPIARAISVTVQVLAALEEVHQHGIIHRDLKPSNVLIRPLRDGSDLVQLADFGIAKQLVDEDITASGLTASGMLMGTPGYLAPEQILSEPADTRSDLYAVGVLLYEMVTGRRLFKCANTADLLRKHIFDAPPTISEPSLLWLNQFLPRALAKKPEDRFPNAATMRRALKDLTPPDLWPAVAPGIGGPQPSPSPSPQARPPSGGRTSVPALVPVLQERAPAEPTAPMKVAPAPLKIDAAPLERVDAAARGSAGQAATTAPPGDEQRVLFQGWIGAAPAQRAVLARQIEECFAKWLGQNAVDELMSAFEVACSFSNAELDSLVRSILVERVGALCRALAARPVAERRRLMAFVGAEGQERILQALRATQSDELASALVRSLLQGPLRAVTYRVPAFSSVAIGCLVAACAELPFADVRPVLVLALNHAEPSARAAALENLSPSQALRLSAEVRKRLGDRQALVRSRAVRVLASIDDTPSVPAVLQLLKRSDVVVPEREDIISALGELGGPEAAAGLRAELGTERQLELRCRIAEALGRIGDTASLEVLRREAGRLLAPAAFKAVCARFAR